MPKALEPGVRFPIALKSDEDKPVATRPVFWVRSLNCRMQEELSELVDSWSDPDSKLTTKEWFDLHIDFLVKHIEDWSNINDVESGKPITFCEDSLRDVLSYQESYELVRKFLANAHLTDIEKKSFGLPHSLNNKSSVNGAALANAQS